MKKLIDIFKNKNKINSENLRKWNLVMAALHAVQGLIILVLSGSSSLPVSTNYLAVDPLTSSTGEPVLVAATRNIFDINIAYLIVAFFFISAAAHLALATVCRKWYDDNLKNHINKARWIEYAFSASIMMVAIALLSGIYDLASLLMIFALVAIMNLLGLAMEVWNQKAKKVNWLTYIIGCIAGIVPWLVVAIYLWGANVYGNGQIPAFVYWIYVSLFIFFNCFALNMYLQYKRKGAWADYIYGEHVYMILSLVAKSALAWQVFFGALRP